ncbi:glycosyltransferase family 87 protein [Flavobacterium capsici]|uniref:Glycosyltransferase family 87 protein n=1 Tax=Flavobacterium capsici TaxID=3075618 RepID=A0AA96F158_9FLAO|nr:MULTISPECIES: glycosyltransferase family 87 protein [unclassified Flavobacterium]WNM19373.1 glycosyltransferase family 87 protein [Flavobacterium sp. PMR2A8]WNM20762.1 glycosyltransferase family 87 protein [Flavobacterium sp. PMTSA4]
MKRIFLKYYPFLPLLLLCGYYLLQATHFPIHDFSNYYFGGKFLTEGKFNSNIYFPYEFNKAISDLGYSGIFASYAPNTPFLATIFLPFAFFSLGVAKLIFNSVSIILLVFSLFRLFNYYKIDWRYALLIPILFLVPIKNSLLFGQVYFLLFFLLTEGWLACEKKQWKLMAFFWSFAILFKVFPVLIVALLLFRKQWKPLLYLTISCFLLFGISVIFTGIDIWFFYLKEVLPKVSNGEIATSFVDNYQSVFMFLKRVFVYESVENPNPFIHASSLFPIIVFAFKIGVLTIGFFVSKRISNSFFAFAFWVIAMILLSPYGSTYTFILLLFPFLALLKSGISKIKKIVFCGLLFLINNLPLSFFIEYDFPFSYLRLFLLLSFSVFFVVAAFQKSVLIKTFIFGCIVFAIGTFLKQSAPQKNESFLPVESPILIYDYQISSDELTYFYWNEKGKNKVIIAFKNQDSKQLEIKNNQIFINHRQLTFDKNHKLKPILIDNKTILYLSDYDRGIGFYTLRKIELH